jgi:hypothetical protein
MSTIDSQANAGFRLLKNVALQTSALQSSSLVGSINMNSIHVIKGVVQPVNGAIAIGTHTVVDSEGNPLLLDNQLVVASAMVAPNALSTGAATVQLGTASTPSGSSSNLINSGLGTLAKVQGGVGAQNFSNGGNKYVTATVAVAPITGDSISVALMTFSPK